MSADRWEQLQSMFETALALDPFERAAFLARCCDDELRAELEGLILEHERLGSFLEHGPIAPPDESAGTHYSLSAGQVVGDRYRIVRLVGRGGMGEVYEAHDVELDSQIALKTLRCGVPLAGRPLERFKREILLGRRITHANVCRIFDLGRATVSGSGPILFLTMEFLDGETLAERLRKAGPFKAHEALPLLRQLANGLDACHERGIVHRDVKSGNVMLAGAPRESSRVVLTDLGLAHTMLPDSEQATPLTQVGRVPGTPGYIAPELIQGKAATPASDIFALGVVMCEMLTGHRPMRVAGAPALPDGSERLDAGWRRAVLRCLDEDPAARFSKATDVTRELEQESTLSTQTLAPGSASAAGARKAIWIAAAVLILAGLAGGWFVYRRMHLLPEQKYIAVLPFRNLSKNRNDDVFCEGLMETLASKLSQLEQSPESYWVVSAMDSRTVTDGDAAFKKLGATLIVTGSFERLPDHARLFIYLSDTRSHRQLASTILETPVGDVSQLEDGAWLQTADMLDLQLDPQVVRRLEASNAKTPAAYEYYTQGMGYLHRDRLKNQQSAVALFQKASALDPAYPLPYAGAGSAYQLMYQMTRDPQWLGAARTNARRAEKLGPGSAPVHLTLGQVAYATGEYDDARRELTKAMDLDPGLIEAQVYLSHLDEQEGNLKEAERRLRNAAARRPGYWRVHSELGTFYSKHGQFEKAEGEFQKVQSLAPDDSLVYSNLGAVYMEMGRLDDAVRTLRDGIRIRPSFGAYSNLGICLMWLGRYPEAIGPMQQAANLIPDNHDLWRNLADAYEFAPGQKKRAAQEYAHALSLAQRQLALNSKDFETMASMALYEAHLGNPPEAVRLIARARKNAPSNNNISFTAAIVYEILGKRRAALEAVKGAYETGHSLEDIGREPELIALRKDPRYVSWLGLVTAKLGRGEDL